MKGYQFLENDFFDLCRTRKVHRLPMLLYIYLRGLYCRFQKPIFTWEDRKTLEHLGITHPTLQKCRKALSEKGLILYKAGNGFRYPTEYTLIGNVLLPKVKDSASKGVKNFHLSHRNVSPSIISSKERLKNRVGLFEGMTEEDRVFLKGKGLL